MERMMDLKVQGGTLCNINSYLPNKTASAQQLMETHEKKHEAIYEKSRCERIIKTDHTFSAPSFQQRNI